MLAFVFFVHGSTDTMGLGQLIVEVSRSHSDIQKSVGLLRTSDQSVQRPLPDNTQHSRERERERHPCPGAGFEPTIPAGERPQTNTLDRAATGIDLYFYCYLQFHVRFSERGMDQTSSRVRQKRNRRSAEEVER
jgi:hypothetical protein